MRYNVQEKYSSAGYGERMRKKHTGLKVLMLQERQFMQSAQGQFIV